MSAQIFPQIGLTNTFSAWVNTNSQVVTELNSSVLRLGIATVGGVARSNTGVATAAGATNTTVTGVGTKFREELQIGDSLTINGETRTIATIPDNLTLTVSVAFTGFVSNTFIAILPSNTVVLSNATFTVGNSLSNVVFGSSGTITTSGFINALSTVTANGLVIPAGASVTANGTVGTSGDYLASNGTSVYWYTPTLIPIANTIANGLMSITTQSFAGDKTFTEDLVVGTSTDSGNAITTIRNIISGSSTTNNFLNITGTLPSTMSAATRGVSINVIGKNYDQDQTALYVELTNSIATNYGSAAGIFTNTSNGYIRIGLVGSCIGSTSAQSWGLYGTTSGSGSQFGVLGTIYGAGTPAGRAGIAASNGPSTDSIFKGFDGSTLVFDIADGGATTISNTLSVLGAVNTLSTLGVTGAVNALSTVGITGALNALSTLGVTGAVTLANSLAVTGNTTLSNTLAVTGNALFLSSLYVGTASPPAVVGTILLSGATAPAIGVASSGGAATAQAAYLNLWNYNSSAQFAQYEHTYIGSRWGINYSGKLFISNTPVGSGGIVIGTDGTYAAVPIQFVTNSVHRMTIEAGGTINALFAMSVTGAVNALSTLGVTGAVNALSTVGITGALNALSTVGITGAVNALSTVGIGGALNALSTVGITGAVNALSTLGVTGAVTLANTLSVTGLTTLKGAIETGNVSATAATGTINFGAHDQTLLYYTTNAAANWTLNIRANSTVTINSIMSVGQAITLVFISPNGATAYYANLHQVDGVNVTPIWQNSVVPSTDDINSTDVYSYTVIKTATTPTFKVLASITKFV
jgi:hypothetical protein